jgi:hypothetical protein
MRFLLDGLLLLIGLIFAVLFFLWPILLWVIGVDWFIGLLFMQLGWCFILKIIFKDL